MIKPYIQLKCCPVRHVQDLLCMFHCLAVKFCTYLESLWSRWSSTILTINIKVAFSNKSMNRNCTASIDEIIVFYKMLLLLLFLLPRQMEIIIFIIIIIVITQNIRDDQSIFPTKHTHIFVMQTSYIAHYPSITFSLTLTKWTQSLTHIAPAKHNAMSSPKHKPESCVIQ